MKSQRKICRTLVERGDGERRWDYAFQFLLRWMEQAARDEPYSRTREEHQDEDCPIRSSIDRPPAATAND
jgi:hypothetical protein